MNSDLTNSALLISGTVLVLILIIVLKSKFAENKIYNSINIFIGLIYSGGMLFYGMEAHNFYAVGVALLIIAGSISTYIKKIYNSTSEKPQLS